MSTATITGLQVAERLTDVFPGIVLEADAYGVTVQGDRVVEAAMFLRDDEELDCKYLNTLLGVDLMDKFDIVYVLSSLARNHTLVLKARVDHTMPLIPSVNDVWMGANLQEREVYDLMGITFLNHPNLGRIFLWEGFPGHPLRKDFLALPGGYKPGLQRFPYEFPQGQRDYPSLQETQSPTAPQVPRVTSAPAGSGPLLAQPASGGQLGALGGGVQGARLRADDDADPEGSSEEVDSAAGTEEKPQS